MQPCTLWRIALALLSIGIGSIVYFFARAGPPIYAIPDSFAHWLSFQPWLATISGQLPGFLHAYAFMLLTYCVLGGENRIRLRFSILLWLLLESLFEVGQHPAVATYISTLIPAWFKGFPLLEVTERYFLLGTFDPLDLVAILLAAVAAWLTIQPPVRTEVHHVRPG